jgi:hypothetical protein
LRRRSRSAPTAARHPRLARYPGEQGAAVLSCRR